MIEKETFSLLGLNHFTFYEYISLYQDINWIKEGAPLELWKVISKEKISNCYSSHTIKELKSDYFNKLNDTTKDLLEDLHVSNKEGIDQIRTIAKKSIENFQDELQKMINELEEKISASEEEFSADVENASKEAHDDVRTSFARIFENIYSKIKELFGK